MAIESGGRGQALKLTAHKQGQSAKGSLLSVIDKTVTGPGARLLASRLSRPLVDVGQITQRLGRGEFFFENERDLRGDLRACLGQTSGDLARFHKPYRVGP